MVLASVRASMPSIALREGMCPPPLRSSNRLLARRTAAAGVRTRRDAGASLPPSPTREIDEEDEPVVDHRLHPIGDDLRSALRTSVRPDTVAATDEEACTVTGFVRMKMVWNGEDGGGEDGKSRDGTTVVVAFPPLPYAVVSRRRPAIEATADTSVATPAPIAPLENTLPPPARSPLDDGNDASSQYRSLIERYMTTATVQRGAAPDEEATSASSTSWTCRRCGAVRRESRRRSAGCQWLLSHLRACVGAAAVEDYCESAARATSATTPKTAVPPPSEKKRRGHQSSLTPATPPTRGRGDANEASPGGGDPDPANRLRIQPDWAVDVCLGHIASPGYRLFQEAVKLVRIPVDLRGGWEEEAVRQALRHLERRTHPRARFLVRDKHSASGNGWRVATDYEVQNKVLTLYRYHFNFHPPPPPKARADSAAEPWPFLHQLALRQLEEGGQLERHRHDNDNFGENRRAEAASNLDAGIIRHVLLESEPSTEQDDDRLNLHSRTAAHSSPRGAAVSPSSVNEEPSELPESPTPSPRRWKRPRSWGPPGGSDSTREAAVSPPAAKRRRRVATAALATADDTVSARWAARARQRRRESVRLEHWIGRVRRARRAVAHRTAALERARQRYRDLAASSSSSRGAAVGANCEPEAPSEPPSPGDASTAADCSAEQLVERLREAYRASRAQSLQLEQRTAWWRHEWVALKSLLESSETPTPEFLAEDARCKHLMSEAHGLLL